VNIVTNLYYLDEIDNLINLGVDIFLLNTDCLTARSTHSFTKDEILSLSKIIHERQKQLYINLNTMVHETDIELAESYFDFLESVDVDGIVIFDWTYYSIAKKHRLEKKLIYQPGTLTTNLYDPWFYEGMMIKSVTLAREITLESISIIIQNKKNIELSIVGHGYQPMFYSRRPLIRNYLNIKNIQENLLNKTSLYLEETKRKNSKYPIFEDSFGTHIFRPKKLQSFEEYQYLKTLISDFFLERFLLSDSELFDALSTYQNNHTINQFLQKYQGQYDSGFYYKQTNLRPEVKQ
jgi:putative protease